MKPLLGGIKPVFWSNFGRFPRRLKTIAKLDLHKQKQNFKLSTFNEGYKVMQI